MPQIHWSAPSLMVASLLVGTLLALGHHLFYASLDRQRAATTFENYGFLGMQLSIQQINTAVGTTFAFLVKASLMLSISIAYFQIFMWSVGNYGKKGTQLVHLDVMTSALHDLVSLLSFKTWLRRPWLWLLALAAWYGFFAEVNISVSIINTFSRSMPIASIITPATLSVGVDFPPPVYMHVPNVDFSSLNLAAPMAPLGGSSNSEADWLYYLYAGPSLTVQRITDAVAAQGRILPVPAPSVNSSWDLDFDGPSLHCIPVSLNFRQAVLDNILNYTMSRNVGLQALPSGDCAAGPGYMAWHPSWMNPDEDPTEDHLPFNLTNSNSSSGVVNNGIYGALNHHNSHGREFSDLASVFLAATPSIFQTIFDENSLCPAEPSYRAALTRYNETSTVLRCDVHKSAYSTSFSFIDGMQDVEIKQVTDYTDSSMVTRSQITLYFDPADRNKSTPLPHACPLSTTNPNLDETDGPMQPCLNIQSVLSTLSYQAVMHAFIDLVAGMISVAESEFTNTLIASTTKLESTVLALTPELAFLQANDRETHQSVQQQAVLWDQGPFTGLINDAAAPHSTLPFQQALEQLFQNITISLMSAPDLQPNTSSIYLPNKTKVTSTTAENIYIYAASKLWLAYGLAVGTTALIASFGLAAMIANDASFSNKFSTILRLSKGAQLSYEINRPDLSGRDPLPAYANQVTVRFAPERAGETKDGGEYKRVDGEVRDDEVELVTQRVKNQEP
ncbi:MAG: hypothetical protein Q9192_006657 [Flavoplaca navasiana]